MLKVQKSYKQGRAVTCTSNRWYVTCLSNTVDWSKDPLWCPAKAQLINGTELHFAPPNCVVPQGTYVASKYDVMTLRDVMVWRHDVTWRHIINFGAEELECTWSMMWKMCECWGIFITRYYWCNTFINLMWWPFWINLHKLTSHWLMKTLAHHGIGVLYMVVQSMVLLPLFLHGQ